MRFLTRLEKALCNLSSKQLSALWFGFTAALLSLPWFAFYYPFHDPEWFFDPELGLDQASRHAFRIDLIVKAWEFFIPVAIGSLYGGISGGIIVEKPRQMSRLRVFSKGVKISIVTAVLSLVAHVLLVAIIGDLDRAPMPFWVFFGAPFYTVISGVSALGLQSLAALRCREKGE